MQSRTSFFISLGVVVVVGIALGLVYQKFSGVREDYPEPPTPSNQQDALQEGEMRRIYATVLGVYGATLDVEVTNPNDSSKKEIRFATLMSSTAFTFSNTAKRTRQGDPTITKARLEDLQIGDAVILTSRSNIRDAKRFEVTSVEIVR